MNGIAITIKTEEEFNVVKEILGKDILYLDWHPVMEKTSTSIVVYSKVDNMSIGTTGSTLTMVENGFKTINL